MDGAALDIVSVQEKEARKGKKETFEGIVVTFKKAEFLDLAARAKAEKEAASKKTASAAMTNKKDAASTAA